MGRRGGGGGWGGVGLGGGWGWGVEGSRLRAQFVHLKFSVVRISHLQRISPKYQDFSLIFEHFYVNIDGRCLRFGLAKHLCADETVFGLCILREVLP